MNTTTTTILILEATLGRSDEMEPSGINQWTPHLIYTAELKLCVVAA